MAEPYNHRAVEQKWRQKWEENPINVNDGKKPKYYCLDTVSYTHLDVYKRQDVLFNCVHRVSTIGNTKCLRTGKVVFCTTGTNTFRVRDTICNKA